MQIGTTMSYQRFKIFKHFYKWHDSLFAFLGRQCRPILSSMQKKKKMQQQPAFPGFFQNIFRKKPTITQPVNQPISAIPIRQYDIIPNYSSMTNIHFHKPNYNSHKFNNHTNQTHIHNIIKVIKLYT
jgi:hypothetical protein